MVTKLVNLVPLIGTNYATWKVQCKMALIRDSVWKIVNGTEIVPDSRTEMGLHAKYLSRKDRALATIALSLEPSLLYLIGDPDDPIVVWKELADQFQKKMWAKKLALRRRLYSLKLKEGDSVHNHIKLMTETFDELSVIGDYPYEENRVVHLLASLSESNDMLVTASQDVPKWALVTERLLYEENKMREKETCGAELKAMTSKHYINKKGPKCFHCGKCGHLKCNCRLLGEDSKESVKRDYPKKKAFFTKKAKWGLVVLKTNTMDCLLTMN